MTDLAILFFLGLGVAVIIGAIVDLGLAAMGRPPTPRRRRRSF